MPELLALLYVFEEDPVMEPAVFADLQLLLPTIIIYNMARVLWDPARQCLHDRRAASIVIAGRSPHRRKV